MCTTVDPPATEHARDKNLAARDWEDLVLHDLRTPLAVVSGQAQLIKRQLRKPGAVPADESAELFGRLDHIVRSALRMAGLLDELQLLAGGVAPLTRRERVDLLDVARDVVADVCASRPEVRIVLNTPALPLNGDWDAGRLERALVNLVGNAAKYSPAGAEVSVTLHREPAANGDWAVVTVHDDGVGIPADDVTRIFEPFHRGSNVASRFEGAGLGLAGVRQTIEQHGGSVSVASREGHGSTFTLRLPLALAS